MSSDALSPAATVAEPGTSIPATDGVQVEEKPATIAEPDDGPPPLYSPDSPEYIPQFTVHADENELEQTKQFAEPLAAPVAPAPEQQTEHAPAFYRRQRKRQLV